MLRRFLAVVLSLMVFFSLSSFQAASAAGIVVAGLSPDQQYALGKEYYETNPYVTFEIWSEAAKADHVQAMLGLGTMYMNGYGVEQDFEQADYWLKKAARFGNTLAFTNLGSLAFAKGDTDTALLYWQEAAKHGEGSAMYNLGVHFYQANELEAAIRWWTEATNAGAPEGAEMMWQLHLYGVGVPQSNLKAVEWLEKGVDAGSASCAYQLGLWYEIGHIVPLDPVKAFEMYKLGAERGHAESMCNLAWCYSSGFGTEVSMDLTIDWIAKSAYAGDPMGMSGYADMLLQMDDEEAHEEAIYWLEQSAALGYEPAQQKLDSMKD